MNKKSIYWSSVFVIILTSLIFILGTDRKSYDENPETVYQVYLNGQTIGVIKSEDALYDLIDKEQKNLKKEYKVNKIYAPIGLEVTKLVTYDSELDDVKEVYNKIKDEEPFTVKGYEVTITHDENNIEKINVLDKKDFDTAVENTIKAFVDETEYNKYLNETQDEILTTGSTIENIDIKENITIKEKYLSTEDKIYRDANELSRYMLFGTDETQGTHIVTAGETIKQIADEYELSVKEFLIVNPEIVSENALLFNGQEVNVGLVKPIISIVVENNLVEDKTVPYQSQTKYDNKYVVGTTWTEQTGQNGISRVEYYTETINGVITQVIPLSTEVIKPVVDEVIVKGGLSINYVGDTGAWYWPTIRPYVITSYFGWRTDPISGEHTYHRGIDISGTGYGSPIYAAQSGTITRIGWAGDMGNYIYIDHGKGFQTIYMHMSGFADGMRSGVAVTKGELIGYMGSTGYSTGTHLDFRIMANGVYIDPLGVKYN